MKRSRNVGINALLNVVKQICAVIFPLVTIPYISRILGAESYGKISFSSSVVNYFAILAGLSALTYGTREGARVRHDKEAFTRFASEVFSLNFFAVIVAYVILGIVVFYVESLSEYRDIILIQSLCIPLNWIGMDWVNTAYEDYAYITMRYILMQVLAIICMFIFVQDANDYIIYVIITTLASSGANIFNIMYIRKYVHIKPVIRLSIFKHLKPMLILLGNSIAVTIYVNSDTTILGFFKTNEEVGIYSIATKIYLIVKQLLNAMLIVFIPRLSALIVQNDEDRYKELLNRVVQVLISLLLPAVVGLMLLSDEIVILLAGTEYLMAGKSLLILGIALLFAVFACFFSNCILLPLRKDKMFLKATLAGCITNVALNFIAIPLWGHIGAALTTAVAEAVVMFLCFLQARNCVKLSVSRANIIATVIGCIGIVLICGGVKFCVEGVWVQVILGIALSVSFYGFIFLLFQKEVRRLISEVLRKKMGYK